MKLSFQYDKSAKVVDGLRRLGVVGFIGGLGRVDLLVDNEIVTSTNLANDDFPKSSTLEDGMAEWGLARLCEYKQCELCGKTKFAPPLEAYDYEDFPELKNKVVCSDCRKQKYDELIADEVRAEKARLLALFPNKGKLKVVDIQMCQEADCNCGWCISLTGNISQVKKLELRGLNVSEAKGKLTVGGPAAEWRRLDRICKLAGGTIPQGYPPL